MVREVNGSNTTPPATTQTSGRNAPQTPAPQPQTPATPAPQQNAGRDTVKLSSNAQALRDVEEKLNKLPEVNEQKVASIKAALESGQYQVDDLVVADKLLGFDDLFQ